MWLARDIWEIFEQLELLLRTHIIEITKRADQLQLSFENTRKVLATREGAWTAELSRHRAFWKAMRPMRTITPESRSILNNEVRSGLAELKELRTVVNQWNRVSGGLEKRLHALKRAYALCARFRYLDPIETSVVPVVITFANGIHVGWIDLARFEDPLLKPLVDTIATGLEELRMGRKPTLIFKPIWSTKSGVS